MAQWEEKRNQPKFEISVHPEVAKTPALCPLYHNFPPLQRKL